MQRRVARGKSSWMKRHALQDEVFSLHENTNLSDESMHHHAVFDARTCRLHGVQEVGLVPDASRYPPLSILRSEAVTKEVKTSSRLWGQFEMNSSL